MKDKNNLEPSDYIMQGCANTLNLNEKETCVCICGQNFDYDNIDDLVKDFQDLQEYRKIEDELGIDLITLFKALTQNVYIYHNKILTKCEQAPCLLCFDGEYCLEYHFDDDIEQVYLKDYGKTWALTKEELKK